MFNFQGSELIIILLLALVVLGPEKLPEAMRKFGEFYGQFKKMSSSFQEEFRAAIDEPAKEIRDTVNTIRDSANFSALAKGERDEKPKSAEMVASPDPGATPTDDVPFADPPSDPDPEPTPGRRPQIAVDDEAGLREARPADAPSATDEGAAT